MNTYCKTYKYCHYRIIDGVFTASFTNNLKDLQKTNDVLMYDVTVNIEDNILLIRGMEDEVHWADKMKFVHDLPYTVQSKYMKYDKGIKIFGKVFFDTPCYVKGWYRTEPMHKVSYVAKNFIVKYFNN